MEDSALFWVIRRVYKESREKSTLHPVEALHNDPVDVRLQELWVLNQDQPRGLKNLPPAMGQERPRCRFPQRFLNLVFDVIR